MRARGEGTACRAGPASGTVPIMARDPNGPIYEKIIDAMMPVADFEPVKGDADLSLPGRVCGACGAVGGVRYRGTTVLEGSLEYYHLVHTEVEHRFHCTSCGRDTTLFKMM